MCRESAIRDTGSKAITFLEIMVANKEWIQSRAREKVLLPGHLYEVDTGRSEEEGGIKDGFQVSGLSNKYLAPHIDYEEGREETREHQEYGGRHVFELTY